MTCLFSEYLFIYSYNSHSLCAVDFEKLSVMVLSQQV